MGYIYMLIDKRNNKKYIGKHIDNNENYWSSGVIPNNIAKKHGKDIFERLILEDGIESNDLLNLREKYFIDLYDTFNKGYNLTIGGDGGGHWIYRKSIEEINKIKYKKSEKLKGRVFSEVTKKKMSDSAKIKIFTPEHRKNISNAIKKRGGLPHTEKTKNKLSKIMSGRKNPEHSEFMKKNNPKSQKVSIDGILYQTIKEASEKLNISRSSVKYRLNSNKYKKWFKI